LVATNASGKEEVSVDLKGGCHARAHVVTFCKLHRRNLQGTGRGAAADTQL